MQVKANDKIDTFLDLVATGVLTKDPKKKKVLLIAEASVKADKKDVERAYRRAQIFNKASDIETLAVLVYKEKTQLRNWV
jgi:hypothetical protein